MPEYEGRWKTIKVEIEEDIAWVTFNRPEKHNARHRGPEHGREEGMKQFLDEKSIKPGLEAYKR